MIVVGPARKSKSQFFFCWIQKSQINRRRRLRHSGAIGLSLVSKGKAGPVRAGFKMPQRA
jgi:hypothetical protein